MQQACSSQAEVVQPLKLLLCLAELQLSGSLQTCTPNGWSVSVQHGFQAKAQIP